MEFHTSIEVCAGAGGQAIGLYEAGFHHLALVENDPHAAATLRTNGQRTKWWKPEIVLERSIVGWSPSGMGSLDLVSGGVPCPPFSIAGRQLGEEDERDLFPAMLKLVAQVEPRAVMIENVRGLMSSKFEMYRDDVMERLLKLGYQADWKLLEAHSFGVPQLRPRSILVATRSDIWPLFRWPVGQRKPPPNVGEILLPSMSSRGWPGANEWARRADKIAPTVVGGSKKHGGGDLGPTRAKRHWRDELGVDALGIADEPPGPDFDVKGSPRLTVGMTALLQGFPPNWAFTGGKTAQYRQVGNAFPAPVAKAVGRAIARALDAADSKAADPLSRIPLSA